MLPPYVFYIAGFYILLSKFSGNENIVVGTPMSGRAGTYLDTVGMFVNTVALRGKPVGTKTIEEFLAEVKQITIDAVAHQDYPYGELVKKLGANTIDRNPLFDVMFAFQSEEMTDVVFGDEKAELLPVSVTTSKYDFTFNLMPMSNGVTVMVEYCTALYREATMRRLVEGYGLILSQMLSDEILLKDISAVTEQEINTLLHDFNDTATDYPRDKCVHQLFEEQAERTPDKTAIIACDRTLTYGELNEQANRIANGLIERGVKSGDIVALVLPRRSYLIAAMFGVLKTGAAYLPIDPDYPQDRINYLLNESAAPICVSVENIVDFLANSNSEVPHLIIKADDAFCALHTSGSTGVPKLSLLKHGGMSNFISANQGFWKNVDTVVSATISTFDVFNMETVLSVAQGYQLVLSNEDDIYNQQKFEKIFNYSTHNMFFATPTKIENYIDNSQSKRFLQQIQSLIIGGEVFSDSLFKKTKEYTLDCRVFNIYGPTETTIWVTADELKENKIVTIGKPISNTQIYIVNCYMQPVPLGVTGELCIAGDGVGIGYLNRPELTAEKFIDNPFGEGKLYKTGDLAYWREDGNIVYVGRNDFQVKIRGLRIELGEIEAAISAVEGVSQAVVVVRKDATGRQFICAFYTENAFVSVEQIRSVLRKKLPRYMIPHVFTRLVSLPMTSSGKVNRNALPVVDLTALETEVEYIAPKTPSEIAIIASVQDVLGIEKVSLLDNFFDLGGDSLKAIELIASLEDAGFHIDTKTIFSCETMMELTTALEVAAPIEDEIVPSGDIPATAAQLRVYTAQEMQGGTAYNVPYVFRAKSIDPERLQRAVEQLIDRHEILRTRFENREGKIMQITEDSVSFTLECMDNPDISTFVRPFDLSKAPLIRVGYYENTVMVDMHHIITDGGSVAVFFRELNDLYMGRALPDTPVQYRAFAARQQNMSAHENYWLSVYREELPELTINTDFKRGQRQSFHGKAVYDSLDFGLREKILAKCKALNITPYVFYLGGFYVLLSKFSGNEDIVIGTPASGREGEFLNTLGMFVNTLAIRNKPEGEKASKISCWR